MRALVLSVLLFFSLAAKSQDIPFYNNAMFWLDCKPVKIGGSWYLQDKSGKGRNFLITGIDLDTTTELSAWQYKSLATISAPPGDGELISVDLNGFFYSAGAPRQIPVTAFYEDVDYAHRLFSVHQKRVINRQGDEVSRPQIGHIIFYKDAKTGTDYLKLKEMFRLPDEYTDANAAFVSESGNDATGNGTFANPYRTPHAARATTKSAICILSGSYSAASNTSTFTGSALTIQGLGNVIYQLGNSTSGIVTQRPITMRNIEIRDSASSRGIDMQHDLVLDRCRIVKTKGSYFILGNSAGKNVTLSNCIIPTSYFNTGLIRNNTALGTITIDGCYGKIINTFQNSSYPTRLVLTYNRGLTGSTALYYVLGATYKDNYTMGALNFSALTSKVRFDGETFNAGLTVSDSVTISNCTITTGNLVGKIDTLLNSNILNGYAQLTAKPNLLVKGDSIYSNATANDVLSIMAAANANIPGVKVDSCILSGSITGTAAIFYLGQSGQAGNNAINGASITNTRIENRSLTTTGQCHTVYLNGINHRFNGNSLRVPNGYGMVIKNETATYTNTDPSVNYNVFDIAGTPSYVILDKGTQGVIAANNTVINAKVGVSVFETNDNGDGRPNSMLCINNLVSAAGNFTLSTGTNMTSRNNTVNPNGFTVTVGALNNTTSVTINSRGVPASRINTGETISGTGNDIGLASNYVIPHSPTKQSQSGSWQPGAIPLQ